MEQNLTGAITFMVATGADAASAFSASTFATGEVAIFNATSLANVTATITAATTNGSKILVAQKANISLPTGLMPTIKTAPFKISDIERIIIRKYNAAQSQIVTAGFDGTDTAKTLSYDCNTPYGIKIRPFSNWINKQYGNAGLNFTAHITTECCDDCDTGCGTGDKLFETIKFAKAFVSNGNAYAPDYDPVNTHAFNIQNFVGVEMIADDSINDTGTKIGGATSMIFTQGSQTVTVSAGTAVLLVAGDYIRVKTSSTNTNDTDAIYLIDSVASNGLSFILSTPWQNATVTLATSTAVASSGVSVVTPATVTAVGLKFKGKLLDKYTGCACIPYFPWEAEGVTMVVSDSINPSFPCAFDMTVLQAMNAVQGSGQQLIFDEIEAQGYDTQREVFANPWANYNYYSQLTAASTYDVAYVYYRLPVTETATISQNLGILEIACASGASLVTLNNGGGEITLLSPTPTVASGAIGWQLYQLAVLAGAPITYGKSVDLLIDVV